MMGSVNLGSAVRSLIVVLASLSNYLGFSFPHPLPLHRLMPVEPKPFPGFILVSIILRVVTNGDPLNSFPQLFGAIRGFRE